MTGSGPRPAARTPRTERRRRPAALAAYQAEGIGRGDRLHTRLRWWWCPFPRIAQAVQDVIGPGGEVLEVGCGHGLLALHLAATGQGRRVTGVDIDGDKIAVARRAAAQLAGTHEPAAQHHGSQQHGAQQPAATVTFEVVPPGFLPAADRRYDAVVVADVLYLLPDADKEQLVRAMATAVRPGGVVVVKETGPAPRWKARWSHFQELLSTRVLRITESVGAGIAIAAPDTVAGWLAAPGWQVHTVAADAGYLWPHYLVVAIAPPAAPRSDDPGGTAPH